MDDKVKTEIEYIFGNITVWQAEKLLSFINRLIEEAKQEPLDKLIKMSEQAYKNETIEPDYIYEIIKMKASFAPSNSIRGNDEF